MPQADDKHSIIVFVFDADPDVPELIELLQSKYGAVTATRFEFTPPIVVVPPPPVSHNFSPRTNQDVLNLFSRVFGPDYWQVISRAGITSIAGNRSAQYAGPDVEDLEITAEEKTRLIGGMK